MPLARIGPSRGVTLISWFAVVLYSGAPRQGCGGFSPRSLPASCGRGGHSEAEPVTARPEGGAQMIYKMIHDFDLFSFCFLAHEVYFSENYS